VSAEPTATESEPERRTSPVELLWNLGLRRMVAVSSGQSETPHSRGDRPETDRPEPTDSLSEAYAERTRQLHEARGSLAEAVATLRTELSQRRAESAALREGLDAADLRHQTLATDNRALYAEIDRLNTLVSDLQNTKVMRWSAGPRRAVHRLRARLR
jgi:predicted RNase H-like nuclease (RuvC/YqgF family)